MVFGCHTVFYPPVDASVYSAYVTYLNKQLNYYSKKADFIFHFSLSKVDHKSLSTSFPEVSY